MESSANWAFWPSPNAIRDLSSGPARQRAAVACVLAGHPKIALLDEPTRGMDFAARTDMIAVLRRLRDGGTAIVLATHDSDLAAEIGDRIVRAEGGRLNDLGSPDQALSGRHRGRPRLASSIKIA